MCFFDQMLCIIESSVVGLDIHVISDVVAVIILRGWIPRGDPDCIDSKRFEIGKTRADSLDIALAITIGISEGADVDLIGDGITPPRATTSRCKAHRLLLLALILILQQERSFLFVQ